MRVTVRLLFVCLLSFILVTAASAQTTALHGSSREWLADLTAILITDDSQATVDDIRLMIESGNGTLVFHAPPGVILAQLPDSAVPLLTTHPNIRRISKTPLNAAAEGITNADALSAIDYFNWVVSGQADATLDAQPQAGNGAGSAQAIVGPPPLDVADSAPVEIRDDHLQLGASVIVNLVFIDGGGSPAFSTDQQKEYYNSLALALTWWNSRILAHFGASRAVNLSFYTIQKHVITQTAGDPSQFMEAPQWINAAMNIACQRRGDCASWFDAGAATSNDYFTKFHKNVREFNRVTRQERGLRDGFTAFVVNNGLTTTIGNHPAAYAVTAGGGWWMVGNADDATDRPATMAHETGHLYWACDEYSGSGHVVNSGCLSCDASKSALNGNADSTGSACTLPNRTHDSCLMRSPADAAKVFGGEFDSEVDRVCWFTRQQIHWASSNCWHDVNWDIVTAGTRWEGQYFADKRIPRMPLLHWSGAPSMVRDDGTANGFSFNFTTGAQLLVDPCLGASAGTPRKTDFSVRWRRKVTFASGDYEFTGTTGAGDDELAIYVDGLQLKPAVTIGKFERIKLPAGPHTVQVDYYQKLGADPQINVGWSSIAANTCPATPPLVSISQLPGKGDYCVGEPIYILGTIDNADADHDGNLDNPPYRYAIQRNQQTPVTRETYVSPFGITIDYYPGTSDYKVVSVVDANNCAGVAKENNVVRINVDSFAPRLNGGLNFGAPVSCNSPLTWIAPRICPGTDGTMMYTLTRIVSGNGSQQTTTTLLDCSTATSFTDPDQQPGLTNTYKLTAFLVRAGQTCATATQRRYDDAILVPHSCPGGTTAITTSSISSAYGKPVTLSARLTGNGSPLANRTVVFTLDGNNAGTGVTNANGDATTSANVTLDVGSHPGSLTARFEGDGTWNRTTTAADVTVQSTCLPANITVQPADRTIGTGTSVSLSLGTSGTAPLTVKWYRANGTLLGSGNPVATTPGWTNQYFAVVSNGCRSMQSRTVTVTLCDPPAITTQPLSATIPAGQLRMLTVAATGTDTLFYRWYANGVPIVGATTNSLNITPAVSTNYNCVVTNGCGTATSATATITVCNSAPSITTQPLSAGILYGQSTTLSVAASGVSLAYQWYANGVAIGGATTNSVTVAPTLTTNYSVVVSNACGSATSATATISVCKPPAITSQPTSRNINNGQSATLYFGVSGTATITYQWYLSTGAPIGGATAYSYTAAPSVTTSYYVIATNGCGTVKSYTVSITVCVPPSITTQPRNVLINPGTSTTLSVNASGTSPEYQWYYANGTALAGQTSRYLTVSPTTTTTYYAKVTNDCGTVQSYNATVSIYVCQPATITQQPVSKTITAGQNATITGLVTGSSPMSYQWYENGVAMPGRTAASTTVTPTQTTSYYIIFTNPCGSAQSNTITVTVLP